MDLEKFNEIAEECLSVLNGVKNINTSEDEWDNLNNKIRFLQNHAHELEMFLLDYRFQKDLSESCFQLELKLIEVINKGIDVLQREDERLEAELEYSMAETELSILKDQNHSYIEEEEYQEEDDMTMEEAMDQIEKDREEDEKNMNIYLDSRTELRKLYGEDAASYNQIM